MFVTIWMCTQEWSLISMRATALTFATCHQPLSWSSSLTRSITVRSLRFARTGTWIRIRVTASAGVSRVSRSASSETGSSMRSSITDSLRRGCMPEAPRPREESVSDQVEEPCEMSWAIGGVDALQRPGRATTLAAQQWRLDAIRAAPGSL